MYTASYRMTNCMYMDAAMPMPKLFCAHLLPARVHTGFDLRLLT